MTFRVDPLEPAGDWEVVFPANSFVPSERRLLRKGTSVELLLADDKRSGEPLAQTLSAPAPSAAPTREELAMALVMHAASPFGQETPDFPANPHAQDVLQRVRALPHYRRGLFPARGPAGPEQAAHRRA